MSALRYRPHHPRPGCALYLPHLLLLTLSVLCIDMPTSAVHAYKIGTVSTPPQETSHVLLYTLRNGDGKSETDEVAIVAVPLNIDGAKSYTPTTPFHLGAHRDARTSPASIAVPDMDAAMRPFGAELQTSPHVLHWGHSGRAEKAVIAADALYRRTTYTAMIGVLPFDSDEAKWVLVIRNFVIRGADTGGVSRDAVQYGFEILALPLHERTYFFGDASAQDRAVTLLYVAVDAEEVDMIDPDFYASTGRAYAQCEWHHPVEGAAFTCYFMGVVRTVRIPLPDLAAVHQIDDRSAAEKAASEALFAYRANAPRIPILVEDAWLDYRNEPNAPTGGALGPYRERAGHMDWRMAALNRESSTLVADGIFRGRRGGASGMVGDWPSFPLGDGDHRIVDEEIGTILIRSGINQMTYVRGDDGFGSDVRRAYVHQQADDFAPGGSWPREQQNAFFASFLYMGPDATGNVERWLDVVVAFRDVDGRDCQGAEDADTATSSSCSIHIWYRWLTWPDGEAPVEGGTSQTSYVLVPLDPDVPEYSHQILPFASHDVARLAVQDFPQEVHAAVEESTSTPTAVWLTVTVTYLRSSNIPQQALNILLYPDEDQCVILPTFEFTDGDRKDRDWGLVSVLHTPSGAKHPLVQLQNAPVIAAELGKDVGNSPGNGAPGDARTPNEYESQQNSGTGRGSVSMYCMMSLIAWYLCVCCS